MKLSAGREIIENKVNYQGKDEKDKVKLFDILLKKTEEIFISLIIILQILNMEIMR